jgi:glutamate synthase (NADPH/NADH)
MMVPEAWQGDALTPKDKRAFYEYHSCIMEPWDGPAMMAFSDGRYMGAVLDRNGLRPSRYYVTHDDRVLLSSEVGVLPDLDPAVVKFKGRLEPGRMFLVDFDQGLAKLDDWPLRGAAGAGDAALPPLAQDLQMFGYTTETLDILLAPMASAGKEALGSMGTDIPLAVLSRQPQLPFAYFKQLFAQVTNPPIDPIREEVVMSLMCPVGPEANLLDVPGPQHSQRLVVCVVAVDAPVGGARNQRD